jgi:Ras-related protein Rab-1A
MSYYGNFYNQRVEIFHSNDFTDVELKNFFDRHESIEIQDDSYIIKDRLGEKRIPHAQFCIMLQRLNKMPSVLLYTYVSLFNKICAFRNSRSRNENIEKNVDEILGLLLAGICQLDCPFKKLAGFEEGMSKKFITNIEQQSLRILTSQRRVFEERLQETIDKFDLELQYWFPDFRLYCQILLKGNVIIDKLFQEKNYSALIQLAIKLQGEKNEIMRSILKKIVLVNPAELPVISTPFLGLLVSNAACAEESAFKKEWLEVLLKNDAVSNPKIWQWIKNTKGGINFVKEHYPAFWVKYLTSSIDGIDSVDSALYLDSLEEICRDHIDIFKIILTQAKCGDTAIMRNLLKAAEKHSGGNINLAIRYIFIIYSSNGTLFSLVNEYFKRRSTQEPLIIPRIEEEAFIEKNLFRLLNSCVSRGYSPGHSSMSNNLLDLLVAKLIKRSAEKHFSPDELKLVIKIIVSNKINHPQLNELLITELIKRSSEESFSGDEVKLSFEFILYNEIQNPRFILSILEQGMKAKLLSVENVKRLVEMLVKDNDNSLLIFNILEKAIDAKLLDVRDIHIFANIAINHNNLSLLRKILNEYGVELRSVIDNALNVKSEQPVNRRRIIGLLYAYKNNQLPNFFEFDFLLEAYCEHSYDIWKASNGTNQTIQLEIKASIGESSYIPGAKEAIWETAQAKFPEINPRESYLACMQHIKDELIKLEGHSRALADPAARDCFVPDQFGGEVDPAVAKMSDAQIKIARYHTALRLLKRDREKDVEYLFNESYFDGFDETVGYCYEIAKRAGCLDAFIQALVDVRRGHNIDNINGKARCLTRKDYPSCSSGAPGRLYQAYVLPFNLILERERSKQEHVLQEFNTDFMNDQIKDFVLKSLSGATRNFMGNAHHHLALLIYQYQANLGWLSTDESKDNAEKAVDYILENEIDYLQLYKQLAGPYATKSISACPAEVKKSLKDIIGYQLRVLFLINEPTKPHLEMMLWNVLPLNVIKNVYPAILLHFLVVPLEPNSPNPVQFNDLVTVAVMMPPEVLAEFRKKLLIDLPTLARFCVRKYSKEESDIFIQNMKSLLGNGVISVENIKSFFKEFFILAAREECFDKKVIVLLECSKDIFGDALKSELKDAIHGLVATVHYKQYGELRNLLQYVVENNLMSKDDLAKIMQKQAQQFITHKDHTAYLRLVRLSSRLDIHIVLRDSAIARTKLVKHSATIVTYNRDEDSLFMRNIQATITSRIGSFGNITEIRKDNFVKLTRLSVQGNAYASFAMAQLYYDKQAISINSANEAQWIESSELAIIYASIAIQQAKVMGDNGLEKEIQLFFEKKLSSEEFVKLSLNGFKKLNLEELYYTYMLELLNAPEAVDFSIKLENLLLIAKSIDLGQLLLNSEYTSDNKTAVRQIFAQCSSGSDLSKATTLLHIYALMEENGCYQQSEGGTYYQYDPRIMAPEIQFQKRYQPVLKALQAIAAKLLRPEEPIDTKKLCEKIAAEIGIEFIDTVEYLKYIYQHMLNKQEYQGNIKNLGKPEHEIINEILTEICKRSNINLNIVPISASVAINSPIIVPKGKEEGHDSPDRSKGKEQVDESPLGFFQSQYQELHERLIGYPEVIETLLNMGILINLMMSSEACEEKQIRELRSYLVMIKISINEDHNLSLEFKLEIDSLTDTMLVLLDNISATFIPFDDEPFLLTEAGPSSSSSSISGSLSSASSTFGPVVLPSSSSSRPAASTSSSSSRPVTLPSSSSSRPAASSGGTSEPAAPSNNSMGTKFISAIRSGLRTFFTEPSESSQAIEPRNPVEPGSTVDDILSDLVNLDQNPNPGPILERRLAGDTPLQAADSRKKILVMGDSGVGKSCFILRLVDNTYTDQFISSIGVDFKLHTATVCGQRFGLQIWDTCGQDRFRNIYGGAHRGADIMVLCFELSDRVSFYNIKRWINEISRFVRPDTKVILIGTKCDLVDERIVGYDEAKGFADAMDVYYLEISAKDNTNIQRFEALIALAPYSQRVGNWGQALDYHIEGENSQRSSYSHRG